MARSVNGSTDRITLVNPDGLTVAGPWTFGIMVEPLGTGGVVKVGPNDGTDGTRGVLLLIKSPSGALQLRSAGGLVDSSTALSPGWNRITVTKAGTGNGLGSVGIGGAQVGATSISAPPALVAGDAINISMGQSDIGVGALPGSVARFFWLQGTALSHAAANAIFDDFDAAVATYGSALSVLNYIEGAVAPEPDFRTPGTNSLAITGTTQVADPIGIPSGDTDPPTLTNATASATGSTTADWSITTNEAGTRYSVAGDPNNTPTDVQVMAGQDHTGSAAVWGSSGAAVVGANAGTATGLAPSTSYRIYHVVEDAATNVSAVASSASFTTVSATSESPTDSYTLTDATQDSVAAAEAQADSTTLGEGVGLRLGFSLDDDTLTLAEIVAGQLAVVQSVADTATLGDAATENVVVAVSLSDSLTLSDDAVAGGVAESRADALTMADEVTASVRAAESVADSVSLSDTVSVRIAAVASVVDSYTLGDTLVTVLATSMSVLDSLTMTDVLAVPMPFNVHPSNILSIQRASPRILTR